MKMNAMAQDNAQTIVTLRDLFYGTVFRFHPVDDIADVLPEVFPGWRRWRWTRRYPLYGRGRHI